MSFLFPSLLWLLLLPASLLLIGSFRRSRSGPVPHPKITRAHIGLDPSSLAIGPWSPAPRPIAASLALAALILALARPQGGTITTPTVTESRDVLVAVDVSRSMLADDVSPDRLSRARLLVRTLTDELQGERLGLLPFAGTAFLQSPLSADYEIFRTFLDELGPDMIPAGGSNFTTLLNTAAEAFGSADADPTVATNAEPPADRFLIILSDGEAQDDTWRPVAQKLADRGVRVLALGLGTAAGTMIPDGAGGLVKDARGAAVLSRLDASTLQALAELTDGAYRDASTWVDLPALLRETVARGRAQRETTETAPRREELFVWFLAPALALLALALVREFPVSPRPTPPRRPAQPRPPTRYATLLAGLVTLLTALGPAPRALAAEVETAPPPPDPLVELVGQLASGDTLAPTDLARLAELTAARAEAARSAPPPDGAFPKGALQDALVAVDQGSAAAPAAADWSALRQRLETLLAPPPEPPPSDQSQKSDGEKNQEPNDEKSPDSSESDSASTADPSDSQDGKPTPSSSENPGDPENSPSSDSSSSDDTKSSSSPGADESPSRPPSDQALGELGQPPSENPEPSAQSPGSEPASEPEAEPAPDAPSQLAGGVSTSDPATGDPASAAALDPALAVPQQRLQRVRDADAPARLFQLLQEAEEPRDADRRAPGTPTRDW